MGACCQSEDKTHKRQRESDFQGKKIADLQVDHVQDKSMEQNQNNGNSTNQEDMIKNYIIQGSLNKIQELVMRNEINVNDHIFFGGTRTILHMAVITGEDPKIVEFLLNSGARVDVEETQTKNTSLYFACVDFKVEIVEELLKQNPRLDHRNENGETVFEYIENTFNPKKKGANPKSLSPEDKRKYDAIKEKLESYKRKMKYTENLDEGS